MKAALDNGILQIDRAKLGIDQGEFDDDGSTDSPPTSSAPPPPPTPPQWAADPHGRHDLRYWDGTSWTEDVSTRGVQSIDAPGCG